MRSGRKRERENGRANAAGRLPLLMGASFFHRGCSGLCLCFQRCCALLECCLVFFFCLSNCVFRGNTHFLLYSPNTHFLSPILSISPVSSERFLYLLRSLPDNTKRDEPWVAFSLLTASGTVRRVDTYIVVDVMASTANSRSGRQKRLSVFRLSSGCLPGRHVCQSDSSQLLSPLQSEMTGPLQASAGDCLMIDALTGYERG